MLSEAEFNPSGKGLAMRSKTTAVAIIIAATLGWPYVAVGTSSPPVRKFFEPWFTQTAVPETAWETDASRVRKVVEACMSRTAKPCLDDPIVVKTIAEMGMTGTGFSQNLLRNYLETLSPEQRESERNKILADILVNLTNLNLNTARLNAVIPAQRKAEQ